MKCKWLKYMGLPFLIIFPTLLVIAKIDFLKELLQAKKEYGDIDVFTANFRPLKATLSGLPDRVFMKLIVCAKTNKVLGLNMCGEDSPEIVQVFFLALTSGFVFSEVDLQVP